MSTEQTEPSVLEPGESTRLTVSGNSGQAQMSVTRTHRRGEIYTLLGLPLSMNLQIPTHRPTRGRDEIHRDDLVKKYGTSYVPRFGEPECKYSVNESEESYEMTIKVEIPKVNNE